MDKDWEPIGKPPLGLMPRWRWLELLADFAKEDPGSSLRFAYGDRVRDIEAAMQRYEAAGKPAPPEWQVELDDNCAILTN